MKFGVCCGRDRFARVKELGYDYIETGFFNLAVCSDEEFEALKSELSKYGFKAEACNGFFGPDVILTGDNADTAFLAEYTEKGMKRAKELGCEVVVLGSGKQRNIPEGFDRKRGEEQFITVLRTVGDIAAKYGIKIAIEPLSAHETNLINTVAESIDIIKRTGHPSVCTLADFYHVFMSGESLSAIENAGDLLIHTHLARADKDRQMPRSESDLKACEEWAKALKKCGYNARMSLEGSFRPEFNETVEQVLPALKIFENGVK